MTSCAIEVVLLEVSRRDIGDDCEYASSQLYRTTATSLIQLRSPACLANASMMARGVGQ